MVIHILLGVLIITASVVWFCLFFDQAVLMRQGTLYRGGTGEKLVALTFDDGPSPIWTPRILDALKAAGIKATFFVIGYHVQEYPEVARRVVEEGHMIANHGFAHSVMLYYTPAEIEEEIKYTEHVIKEITGRTTQYFRPPKAWLTPKIKKKIRSMGYEIVLWSLNSKDWVSFSYTSMVRYLASKVQNGDILLFHDSGSVLSREGGDRGETVKSIALLGKTLKDKGFKFVTIEELKRG